MVEQTVEATWLGRPQPPKTTADLVLYTNDEIHVLDSKWGRIKVEAWENVQLLYYAASYGHLAPRAKGVKVHIMQPMIDNFDSWYIDSVRLKQFMADAIAADSAIQSGSVKFGPSDECKFCPANPHGRGAKGSPACPVMLNLLYPRVVDEDAILDL